jgi:outer membrane protein TolC
MALKRSISIMLLILAAVLAASAAQAKTLADLLPALLDSHERMQAATENQAAAQYGTEAAKAGWNPKVDVTGDASWEDIDISNQAQRTTGMYRNKEKLRGTQLLWDFGRTDAVIGQSQAVQQKASADKALTRQALIREGAAAYLGLLRSSKILGYVLKSQKNFAQLVDIEQSKLKAGQGDELKVLQAKGQLEGSRALRVQSEMDFGLARNRFKSVYGYFPSEEDLSGFENEVVPAEAIPPTPEEAIASAHEKNSQLRSVAQAVAVAESQIQAARSKFYPMFNAYGEYERKENDQNKMVMKEESRYGMEFAWNLYSGGGDTAAQKAATHSRSAAANTLADLKRTVEEQVRNSWVQLLATRSRAELFKAQADTEGKYLQKAKKEREIGGETSLTDVILAENNYIAAMIGLTTADTEKSTSAFDLLYAMGVLDLDLFLK